MICKDCNEHMDGDGYHSPLRCPYADDHLWIDNEPDANPVYCGFSDEEE